METVEIPKDIWNPISSLVRHGIYKNEKTALINIVHDLSLSIYQKLLGKAGGNIHITGSKIKKLSSDGIMRRIIKNWQIFLIVHEGNNVRSCEDANLTDFLVHIEKEIEDTT